MSEEWDEDQSFDEGWFLDYLDGAFTILCAAEGSAYHIEALARTQLL